jgi:Fibronectin type III domain/Secretion system C-terminal sorting domain
MHTPNEQINSGIFSNNFCLKNAKIFSIEKPSIMKKNVLFLLVALMAIFNVTIAQTSTANYANVNNATGSLQNMTGSTQLFGANIVDATTPNNDVYNLGFDFWYLGVRYTTFSANTNGAIQLHGFGVSLTPIAASMRGSSAISANVPVIAPFLGHLKTSATGKVHYITTGTAPNRKFTMEFLNMGMNRNSSTADATFQVSLYETSGVIQFVYGGMKVGSIVTAADQIVRCGLYYANVNNSLKTIGLGSPYLYSNTTAAYTNTFNVVQIEPTLNSAADGSRKQIIMTPIVANAPTGVNVTAITNSTCNINWTDAATNEKGYVIYYSSDGGLSYEYLTQTAANAVTYTATGLVQNTAYIFRVYSVTEGALSAAVTGTCTTTNVCAPLVNTVTITTTGALNWSALAWSAGHVPTSCEDAVINLVLTGNTTGAMAITLDKDFTVKSLRINNGSTNTAFKKNLSFVGYVNATILGDLTITCSGGFKWNFNNFSNQKKTTIYGNVVLGSTTPTATEGFSAMGSSSTLSNQQYILYGNMTFNKRSYTTDEHAVFNFEKVGTQFLINNTVVGDTTEPVLFEILNIGMKSNATTLQLAGTSFDAYIESANRSSVNIGSYSTLDLPANYNLNSIGGVAALNMAWRSKLKVGGNNSSGSPYGAPGSNFPASFTNYNFTTESEVHYYGANSITQTIHAVPVYANLRTSYSDVGVWPANTPRAKKITIAPVTVSENFNIGSFSEVTLGGAVNVTSSLVTNINGGLFCGPHVVSGAASFRMWDFTYLGSGHAQGISNSGSSTGNIQVTGTRNYCINGNGYYLFNGAVPQIVGNAIPTSVPSVNSISRLIIDNPTSVTANVNLAVSDSLSLVKGVFDIGTTTFISFNQGQVYSLGGKMKADRGVLFMSGIAPNYDQTLFGNSFVNRTISTLIVAGANGNGVTVNNTVGDSLKISSAMLYGATNWFGNAISNTHIYTGNNITLLSVDTTTARFGEIVTGSGNTIVGNVTVERYQPISRKWKLLSWPTTSTQTARQSWMEGAASANANPKPGYGTIVTDDKAATWSAAGFDSKSVSGPSIKYWDPATNTFVGIPNTHTYQMNSQSAYFNYVRGNRASLPAPVTYSATTLRSTGTLKTGNQTFMIPAAKFAAVGNPYASAIDLRKIDTTNISGSVFYVWDCNLAGAYGIGGYQMLYASGADYRIMPGGGSYPGFNSIVDTLESGSAFFVRAAGTNGTITFKEEAKNVGARVYAKGGNPNSTPATYSLLSLVDPGVITLVDGAMAAFKPNYSNDVDYDDALKLSNTSENVSYKRNGTLLAIERRKTITTDDTLFLNLSGLRIHTYQWDINVNNMQAAGRSACLVDKFLNTTKVLGLDTVNYVQFDVNNTAGSYAADRFMIVFKQVQVSPMNFVNITAVRNANKTVKVNWSVANELNIANYSVERSIDGINFASVATQIATANNGGTSAYSINDATAPASKVWYRVKSTSFANANLLSATVIVNAVEAVGETSLGIYPNPVENGNVNVQFANQPQGEYTVQITSKNGQILSTEIVKVNSNNVVNTIHINNLATGSYQATIINAAGEKTTISFLAK